MTRYVCFIISNYILILNFLLTSISNTCLLVKCSNISYLRERVYVFIFFVFWQDYAKTTRSFFTELDGKVGWWWSVTLNCTRSLTDWVQTVEWKCSVADLSCDLSASCSCPLAQVTDGSIISGFLPTGNVRESKDVWESWGILLMTWGKYYVIHVVCEEYCYIF